MGTPLDHTSIPFLISAAARRRSKTLRFQQARAADILTQVDVIDKVTDVLRPQYELQQQSSAVTDEQAKANQQTAT